MTIKRFWILSCIILLSISANNQSNILNPLPPPTSEEVWVDSVFNSLSADERIGQLFMIRAHSDKSEEHIRSIEKLIKEYKIGGVCFFQGTPFKQAELTNRYQSLSKIPLLVAIDGEWGLAMRLNEVMPFPKQLMLGAIQNNQLIYDMGAEVARQCRRLGVHINFAPDVDVNNNANNPVINDRSFGEDKYNVAAKGYMYMLGMQENGIMACAKHFPGHGDTDVDSHLDLPIIKHDRNRLDSIELLPFKVLAQQGVQSMMVGHLNVPALDDRPNMPTTLSDKVVTNLLRHELRFDGLIFTDAMEMKGVTKYYKKGEAEAKALAAGNDILLLPNDIGDAIQEIKNYIRQGVLDINQVQRSVKRVLHAKYCLGLTQPQFVNPVNLVADLNTPKALALKRKLIKNAITVVRNPNNIIPIRDVATNQIATLSIGAAAMTPFQKTIKMYGKIDQYYTDKEIASNEENRLLKTLSKKNLVIVSIHDMSRQASKGYGITASTKQFIKALSQQTNVIVVVFGNPYSLKYFDDNQWLVQCYDEDSNTQDIAAQIIFGAISASGRLPVTASPKSKSDDGLNTAMLMRLGYDIPESVGLRSEILLRIDDIANEIITTNASPGCVVLVAKDGKVVFNKGYGRHTYDPNSPAITSDAIYDIASVTKVAATTTAIMKLHEEDKISIFQPLSVFLPELATTNKAGLTIEHIMEHRAGLRPWIPFYETTMLLDGKKGVKHNPLYYSYKQNDNYAIQVCDDLYLLSSFRDSIRLQIDSSALLEERNYRYSDLGFYLLADLVARITNTPINYYVQEQFYKPLGMSTMTYNPLQKFPKELIPPTEIDNYFRLQTVQGHVHDMGAAMLNGVSGHAGLFSNANDLAILFQMLLNGGTYGGKTYFNPETVRLFTTRCYECSRRAIGFDTPETSPYAKKNVAALASPNTFGHIGFTGTCVWADPQSNMIFVFLSNRTYPNMKNNKLHEADYRPRLQNILYEAKI